MSNRLLELGQACFDLAACEVFVARVHALELAAINRRERLGEQADLAADDDELRAGCTDRRAIETPEVSDGLEACPRESGDPVPVGRSATSARHCAGTPVQADGWTGCG